MIRVVMADDHCLVRQALEGMLNDECGIEVVEQVSTGEQAIGAARSHRPDIVLMDLEMPGMGGLEATLRIRRYWPRTAVIAVTAHDSSLYAVHALRAGAQGYVHKSADRQELIQAIRRVSEGQCHICDDVARYVALTRTGHERDPFQALTQRELQVLMHLLRGRRSSAIAEELRLSPKTVSSHRKRLFARLGVCNEAELARMAIDYGIIELPRPALSPPWSSSSSP